MKKFLLSALLVAAFVSASAQEPSQCCDKPLRKKYININYVSESLSSADGYSVDSKFGAAFTVGRTYYLHRKPLARMIRFGIDATWFDINYANYKSTYTDESDGEPYSDDITLHKAEIGMQVGPSITINPVSKLNAQVYFRYAPSFGAIYDTDVFAGNYASMFVSGVSVSYGVIGIGVEKRWGNCKYKEFGGGDEDGGYAPDKMKTSGLRAYITFRF